MKTGTGQGSRDTELDSPSAAYFFLRKTGTVLSTPLCPRDFCCTVLALAPVLVLLGALLDDTMFIETGKGLAQHYGFWAIFISTPLLVLSTSHLLESFTSTFREFEGHLKKDGPPAAVQKYREIVCRELASMRLETKTKYILYFGIVVTLLYFILNVVRTFDPLPTYDHDVFDAWRHPWGYSLTKVYLVPVIMVVYPVAIFVSAHATLSMTRALRFAREANILKVDFFAEDKCGGMSRFGYLNLQVMIVYLLMFSVLGSMVFTHQKTYFVTRSALLFCSSALLLQSFLGVLSIQRTVALYKRHYLTRMAEELNTVLDARLEGKKKPVGDLLALQSHIASVHTLPYTKTVNLLVNAVRFLPATLAVISLIFSEPP